MFSSKKLLREYCFRGVPSCRGVGCLVGRLLGPAVGCLLSGLLSAPGPFLRVSAVLSAVVSAVLCRHSCLRSVCYTSCVGCLVGRLLGPPVCRDVGCPVGSRVCRLVGRLLGPAVVSAVFYRGCVPKTLLRKVFIRILRTWRIITNPCVTDAYGSSQISLLRTFAVACLADP